MRTFGFWEIGICLGSGWWSLEFSRDMSIRFTIDGREVEVAEGQTIVDAARQLGIDVPTLCYLERCGPMTSCLVCIVKLKFNGRISVVPSCGMKAQPGMIVESETEEVRDMRRTALELLLSDHVGDCLSPCHRICPLRLNIPVMLRHVERGEMEKAIEIVRDVLPMPAITGRLCNHPCENGCRRGTWDESMHIRDIERNVGDAAMNSAHVPSRKPASGKSVAVIGAGPAGLAAAWQLVRDGHACVVFDRNAEPGGSLRRKADEALLPRSVIEAEVRQLARLGVQFNPGVELGIHVTLPALTDAFDAVLLAFGESAKSQAELLGLQVTPTGIKANPESAQTPTALVFATGSAVKPVPQVTRAMSEGIAVARCVDQFLCGKPIRRAEKVFSSIMGRVERKEVETFVRGVCSTNGGGTSCGSCGFVGDVDASTEASRCLHCDCRAAGKCGLQHYAGMLGADPNRFRQQRRLFVQQRHPANVLFEPGKCILCGICVEIAKQAAEPLGLTFIGRGFDVRVGAPMDRQFEEGLRKVAAECVEGCPTGAIVFGSEASVPTPKASA